MKNFGLTLLLFLFVGATTTMAQDKKADDSSAKTEVISKDAHKCTAAEKKACCAKAAESGAKSCHGSASADKKACSPGCQKACCTADAATKKDEHEEHDH
ncbi:MAG: hypothetical protein H6601_02100 [Flavobacteriales bacterium]|nr:hypothetical protein [Flavobacteriales bacterium]